MGHNRLSIVLQAVSDSRYIDSPDVLPKIVHEGDQYPLSVTIRTKPGAKPSSFAPGTVDLIGQREDMSI